MICSTTSHAQNKTQEKKPTGAGDTPIVERNLVPDFQETPINLKNIVRKIEGINEVQSFMVGVAGVESDNFKNFITLKKVATSEDLVRMTDNKNSVVACYAAMALADKFYPDLKAIFQKFLSNDRQARTFSGCIKSKGAISSELYHHYWNSIDDNAIADDKILIELDSIVLFQKNINWLLIARALENRLYIEPYKSQITFLAFDKGNIEAIYYLCNWHKAEYTMKLQSALLKYLKNTNFSNTGTPDYYKTVSQLFSFNDAKIQKEIIAKMKRQALGN